MLLFGPGEVIKQQYLGKIKNKRIGSKKKCIFRGLEMDKIYQRETTEYIDRNISIGFIRRL